jgi:hypothetical protein
MTIFIHRFTHSTLSLSLLHPRAYNLLHLANNILVLYHVRQEMEVIKILVNAATCRFLENKKVDSFINHN